MTTEHIHFVTGRLAEPALQSVVTELVAQGAICGTVQVLPITVAALMTPTWIARHLRPDPAATQVMVPGYCTGDLELLQQLTGLPVIRGPRDLRELPAFFGRPPVADDFGPHDIEILAEINHAPRMVLDTLVSEALRLAADGADIIDVGCEPDGGWSGVETAVRALRDQGLRVSIDSFDPREIAAAVRGGAELVLSVNETNRHAAVDWGVEVVAIPTTIATLGGLDATCEFLAARRIPFRIDPILEPIGCGFSSSLGRYLETRRRYPDAPLLMGIGNLTELSEADSAAVNLLLLGFCQEQAIRSVLTTQVINWARSSVRECARARQMVHYAVRHGVPPKHVAPDYVLLRDPRVRDFSPDELNELSRRIRDRNYRLFAAAGQVHLVAAGLHLSHEDPFALFAALLQTQPTNLDPSHAFYLGYELCKARTALTLGKQYEQDESLRWGFLTQPESHQRLSRTGPPGES